MDLWGRIDADFDSDQIMKLMKYLRIDCDYLDKTLTEKNHKFGPKLSKCNVSMNEHELLHFYLLSQFLKKQTSTLWFEFFKILIFLLWMKHFVNFLNA